jgi:hypothetical protein
MEWDLPALEGATPGGGPLLGERGGIVIDVGGLAWGIGCVWL